jgi:hypothetical protein
MFSLACSDERDASGSMLAGGTAGLPVAGQAGAAPGGAGGVTNTGGFMAGAGGVMSTGGTAAGGGGGAGGIAASGGQGGSVVDSGADAAAGSDADAGDDAGDTEETCPLPSTFSWTSTGPLAEPMNPNARSLKDFSVTKYNGKYLVYGTTANGAWNGFMSTFSSFDEWATAEQHYIRGLVAPTIFYFTPKDVWVLAYQWGFKYATTTTPDVPSSWSATQPLINYDPAATGDRGTGPIDQTIICDDATCYIFYNDDVGGIYRGSMPIGQFPGKFTNDQRIIDEPTSLVFEGIQVYSIKGSDSYLMLVENNGIRAFRAWTATDLGGEWTLLEGADTTQEPFAGENNVSWPGGKWTRDISHGDLVRENPSEKMEIDPCNLQFLYQGRDPNQSPTYIDLPYRPGLLTLQR